MTMRLWDADTGQEVRVFKEHRAVVWGVALSPDGRHASSGTGSPDNKLRLWDVATG